MKIKHPIFNFLILCIQNQKSYFIWVLFITDIYLKIYFLIFITKKIFTSCFYNRLNLKKNLHYFKFVTQNSKLVFFLGLVPALIASLGMYNIHFTTDPVELWSSPASKAREQRDFFNTYLTLVIINLAKCCPHKNFN